jgi:tetratricopeptide (TPR) repeat protein
MTRIFSSAVLLSVIALTGCGGGATTVGGKAVLSANERSGFQTSTGDQVHKEAAKSFDDAIKSFVAHDKSFDWNEGSCKEVAAMFAKASDVQQSATRRAFPSALYNAGLSYQRCELQADAQQQFQAALTADHNFHRAATQLALYEYQKNQNLDSTIDKLNQIIHDAKFQNADALVGVAALQMERQSDQSDSDGKNDLERAVKNIQRALAIDDTFMPAFNQLAIYYLEQAKAKAGKKSGRKAGLVVSGAAGKGVDQQMLDLAALVAAQGVTKNPKYASIYNTAGLIQVEQRNYNGAVKSFKRARELDPKFFEAHMNYGAVNLSFRGFKEADAAYRDALKLKPKEYEAHLGLALALRGAIDDSNFDKNVSAAQAELDECKKIDADRPETYYNEAILTQEYRAKGSQEAAVPMLEKAADIYKTFINKASGNDQFAGAVKRAKERSQDIADTVKFIREGEAARKADEEAQKQAAAAAKNAPPAATDAAPKPGDAKGGEPPPPADAKGAAPPPPAAPPKPAGKK